MKQHSILNRVGRTDCSQPAISKEMVAAGTGLRCGIRFDSRGGVGQSALPTVQCSLKQHPVSVKHAFNRSCPRPRSRSRSNSPFPTEGRSTSKLSLKAAKCILIPILTLFCQAALAKLNVVVTTPDLASIAREIGGNLLEITTLAKPTEDPHFVDAKPSFIVKLNRADALIEGGAELEIGWLPALLDQARNSKLASGAPGRIACSQGIALMEVPSALDRSRGDIHAAGNPHYLVDPRNAKIVAEHIANAFCALDQKSCETYRSNLKKFTDTINARLTVWEEKLAPFKGQQLAAYHNSWLYFANRFGLKIDLFLEPKPGVPPTPTHLAEVITKMKQDKVHVIIVDPYLNRRTAETVGERTGATVVDVSQFPGGIKGTEGGYVPLMDYLVNSISKALGQSR